jgi:hypothetical protein
MKPKTSTLGPAGRKLKAWIEGQFSTDGVEPMVEHVCELADLQAALKADIQKRGVVLSDGSRNPSTDATLKASAAFARAWRILGLADAEKPAAATRR